MKRKKRRKPKAEFRQRSLSPKCNTSKIIKETKEKAELIENALEYGVDLLGRRIFLHGQIDEDSIAVIIRGLYILGDDQEGEPIELFVTSYGGYLDDTFALHDVTRTLRCPVHTMALGKCMSAAPLLVACGKKGERYAAENTMFMLHDAQLAIDTDNPRNVIIHGEMAKRTMKRYAEMLGEYTLKDAKHWSRIFDSKTDKFFTAEQAKEWGLIDHIWSEKD